MQTTETRPEFAGLTEAQVLSALDDPNPENPVTVEVARLMGIYAANFTAHAERLGRLPQEIFHGHPSTAIETVAMRLTTETIQEAMAADAGEDGGAEPILPAGVLRPGQTLLRLLVRPTLAPELLSDLKAILQLLANKYDAVAILLVRADGRGIDPNRDMCLEVLEDGRDPPAARLEAISADFCRHLAEGAGLVRRITSQGDA